MYKVIIAILVSASIVGFLAILYLLFLGSAKQDKISITDKSGAELQVNDFLKTAKEVNDSAITIQQEQNHPTLFYNKEGNLYSIVLNVGTYEEFIAQKPAAENDFLEKLGISKEDACKLNVVVSNAGSFDERLQNGEFPLSFCN